MAQTPTDANVYFVPAQSKWPFVGSIAMMVTMVGVASWLNDASWGRWTFYIGIAMLVGRFMIIVPVLALAGGGLAIATGTLLFSVKRRQRSLRRRHLGRHPRSRFWTPQACAALSSATAPNPTRRPSGRSTSPSASGPLATNAASWVSCPMTGQS